MSISWTAEGGFVSQPSRMRMVGQRPAADDGRARRSRTATKPGTPGLRYLPAPGPRHERPRATSSTSSSRRPACASATPSSIVRPRSATAPPTWARSRSPSGGTVHLPAELGDINELQNKAIVAHELTHVAQQQARRHVPSEDSPEGRELEARGARRCSAVSAVWSARTSCAAAQGRSRSRPACSVSPATTIRTRGRSGASRRRSRACSAHCRRYGVAAGSAARTAPAATRTRSGRASSRRATHSI